MSIYLTDCCHNCGEERCDLDMDTGLCPECESLWIDDDFDEDLNDEDL